MHVDGQAVRTCILPVSAVAGKQVTTIEGLGTPDSPHPLQAAWASLSVPQCGYCQPGQIMSAAALLASNQNPSEDHVEQAMAKEGDLAAGFEVATAVVENDYWAPYLAHAPMEPMNAVAHVQGDHADVWCGTQGIGAAQKIVARLANLDIDKVRAHSVYLGGGFGRRATLTHVVEATQISLATGKPIQVLWSHEDDLKSGVFRPASLMRIKAGVDQDGRISAWQAKRVGGNVAPGMLKVFLPAALPTMISDGVVDWISGMAEGAMDGWVVDPTSPDEESQACGVDIVGATHASPAPVVLGCPEVGRCMHRPYGARNSGHLRSRFCYFDTLLPLASCRKLDPLRTPRADISVGPFSLGKAVLCLGLRPTSSNPRPSGARCARVHLRSCSDVANLGHMPAGQRACTPRARRAGARMALVKYPARSRKADSGANCNLGHGGYLHDNQQLSCE